MDRNASVHNSIYDFEIGNKVNVSKYFDANEKTKKLIPFSFFSNEVEIIENFPNNRVIIRDDDANEEVVLLPRI